LAAVCLLAVAADKRAITHSDLWSMRRVEAPVLSPDGKWVVTSVTEPAYDEAYQVSDLWLVAVDGGTPPRRITHSRAGESGVTWSSDSKRIGFSAKRDNDEAAQIYILELTVPGEAVRATSISTGASGPKFSPDGRSILFQSTVYPGAADDEANRKAAAERKARKYRARVYDSFPVRYWDKWLEDTQRHVFVQALAVGSKPRDLLAGTKLGERPGFAGASTNSGQDLHAVWAPDSHSIVFTATENKHEAAYGQVRTALYAVPAAGGEPRRLTSGTASYSRPAFRPDGKALYAIEEAHTSTYNLERIAMWNWPNPGQPAIVTAGFDQSVAGFGFSPDSRHIYLTAEDAGHEKLYTVAASGGTVASRGDLKVGCFSNLASADKAVQPVLVANFDSAVNPPEVVRLDPSNGAPVTLTSFNSERAAQLDLPPLREFWFTTSKGKKIHSMVALPPRFTESRKYPLFVVIHGGPHSMWRDQWVTRWNYHLLGQPGYVVLLTNYTGSTGYGEKFAQSIQGDPLAGPGQEIVEAADAAIKQYPFIDASRQAAGGASYGGHLANWLEATTTRFKCLISHAGLINLESQWGSSDTIFHREQGMGGPHWEGAKVWQEQNPVKFAAKFRTPMLVTVGENDFRVPLNQSLENWSVLQRMKVPSRLIVFPEENHWILKGENSRFFYQQVHEWLARWLNAGPGAALGKN
jgi:dipeptidyl aminopeptidase/acylaminoacyl peptidase